MRIALIGYGKMGKTIEEIAVQRGHEISLKINSQHPLSIANLEDTDVAIEFTRPELAAEHITYCVDHQIPIVVGTTAWTEKLPELTNYVQKQNAALLHASNFSIGVNIFFEINKHLASLMSEHSEYKAQIDEIHHLQKLDAPSGTAISLANQILENNDSYFSWVLGEENAPHTCEGQLGITSFRETDVPGTHTITYSSEIDTISITHEAHNRKGFALGAVIAAEFLYGKTGVFTMKDVLKLK
jgi:4-hydroxy-tetrahydrodipicolinate reductase